MGTMEQKRQIVQEGLDKRKAKRKNAEEEAYQEAIEAQMIDIVNKNCSDVNAKKQKEVAERKEQKRNNKKIAMLKKRGNKIVNRLILSVATVVWASLLYAIGVTQLWMFVVFVVLAVAYFAFNVYVAWQNAGRIAELM